jgi:hypothetical protein
MTATVEHDANMVDTSEKAAEEARETSREELRGA